MDLQAATGYINGIYGRHGFNQQNYVASTELKDFVAVVDDDVARMLEMLIALTRPKRILEIGTSIGFSTTSMAKAVEPYGGKIVTIELDKKVAEQAGKNFKREGVAEIIEIIIGDASEILPLMEGNFEMIFQDVGDKELYSALFEDCVRLLKPGGILVAEDTLFPVMDIGSKWEYIVNAYPKDVIMDVDAKWNRMRKAIEKFNEKVANCDELKSTLLLLGDGLTVAVKK